MSLSSDLSMQNPQLFHHQDIWPRKQPNVLNRYSTTMTSQRQSQLQFGLNPKPIVQYLFGTTEAVAHTYETGQSLSTMFQGKEFRVSLGVDEHSPAGTSTATSVEFGVLMALKHENASMTLELSVDVTYVSSVRFRVKSNKTVRAG